MYRHRIAAISEKCNVSVSSIWRTNENGPQTVSIDFVVISEYVFRSEIIFNCENKHKFAWEPHDVSCSEFINIYRKKEPGNAGIAKFMMNAMDAALWLRNNF